MRRSRVRVALVALCLVSAACTGAGDAETSPGPSATTSVGGRSGAIPGFQAQVAAFATCLRRHGVDVADARFDEQGRLTRWLDLPAGVTPSGVRDAADACAAETPEVVVDAPALDPRMQTALTEFVACMRDRGAEDMPDPTPEGLVLEGSGVAPDSAGFRRAERHCEHLLEGFE